MEYSVYKISIPSNECPNTIRKIRMNFFLDDIEIVDVGYDIYNYLLEMYVYSLYIIVDVENLFLDAYIKDTIKHLNIKNYSNKILTTDEYKKIKKYTKL